MGIKFCMLLILKKKRSKDFKALNELRNPTNTSSIIRDLLGSFKELDPPSRRHDLQSIVAGSIYLRSSTH